MIKKIEASDPRVREVCNILGLPDEAYQSITIKIVSGDVVRVEAEFIAKGDDRGDMR